MIKKRSVQTVGFNALRLVLGTAGVASAVAVGLILKLQDRDFRFYVNTNYPKLLDFYYTVDEATSKELLQGQLPLKEKDFYVWKSESRL